MLGIYKLDFSSFCSHFDWEVIVNVEIGNVLESSFQLE